MTTTADRFWAKVDIRGENDCWPWTASRDTQGYGQAWNGERQVGAHRTSYEYARGPVPAGMQIDHLCRNRICVNPHHLEAVTQRENLLRGQGFAAINGSKTHCIHGHEFTAENTIRRSNGRRGCRECRRELDRRRRVRRRANAAA